MLRQICSAVYRMGFRPKPGTMFYSRPSALETSFEAAVKKMKYPVVIDLRNKQAWTDIAETVKTLDLEEEIYAGGDPQIILHRRMNFCVMCGTLLVALVVDVKQCPHMHGSVRTIDGPDGLPSILFKPTEGLDW